MKKKSFTLIELIAVIVILGIISVVAIPKYVNMQKEAADAAAKGIYGAASSACALNYAKGAVGQTITAIDSGANLLSAMEGNCDWTAGAKDLSKTVNGVVYKIEITTDGVAVANNATGTMAVLELTADGAAF